MPALKNHEVPGPWRSRLGWRYRTAIALLAGLWAVLLVGVARAEINVAFVNIEKQDSYSSMRVYAGRTVAARAAQLGFKRGGEISVLHVDMGNTVSQGQTLASLDTEALQSNLRQAAAEITLAKANLTAVDAEAQLAMNTEKRFRRLREQGHTSKQTYDEARLNLRAKSAQLNIARANLEKANAAYQAVQVELAEAEIVAPFDGIIQARYVDEGTQVTPGQAALRLVERDNSEAHVGIPTELATLLQPGETYVLRWNNQEYAASLAAVLPEVDPATRTLTAVLQLQDDIIPLGSVVELNLREDVAGVGFWLPLSALTASDRGLWGVYVINDNEIIERRLVEIVHSEADRVFVRGTLAADDRVVHTGVQRIVPGQKVDATRLLQASHAG